MKRIWQFAICWLLAGLWLPFALGVMAQDIGESCHNTNTVFPRVNALVRAEPNFDSQRVGLAQRGEAQNVSESRSVGALCWLRLDAGWALGYLFVSFEPTVTTSSATTSPARECYTRDKAYVGGPMNIRAQATTDSPVVAKARFGDEFAISTSLQGETWCWLKVAKGWMAKTSRVSVTKPIVRPTPVSQPEAPAITEAPHRVVNSQGRSIPLYGNDDFRLRIAKAFYYLRDNVPQWWPYVSILDDFKYEDGACTGEYACANWPYKGLYFGHHVYGVSVRGLASTLIHEACHIYQWQEGRGDNYDWSLAWEDRPHEIECINKQREAGL